MQEVGNGGGGRDTSMKWGKLGTGYYQGLPYPPGTGGTRTNMLYLFFFFFFPLWLQTSTYPKQELAGEEGVYIALALRYM